MEAALAAAQTARLTLRAFREDDLDELAGMVADPEQMRFYPGTRSREDAAAWLRRNIDVQARHGYSFWLAELRATAGFAGYCGIRPLELDGARETEIGWHVRKDLWSTGLATEAAAAARDVALQRFGLARLVALIDPEHDASRRVAEKLGLQVERATELEGQRYLVFATVTESPGAGATASRRGAGRSDRAPGPRS